MLTSLVYVEPGRGIRRIMGVVRRGSRSQGEDGHDQWSLLWTRLERRASHRNLLADLVLLQPRCKPEKKYANTEDEMCVTLIFIMVDATLMLFEM